MSGLEREILADVAIVPERAISDSVEALVREHARMVFKIAYSVLRRARRCRGRSAGSVYAGAAAWDRAWPVRNQKAWIARIAWREALRRSKQREQPQEEVESAIQELREERLNIDEVLAQQQQLELLRALIATLPRDLREPLVLSTVQEMSNSDIAEVLAIPEASVRTRMARARTMLKQKLEVLLRSHSR